MPKTKKTDNRNLSAKLALRRYFLNKYHADGAIRVLDCCQGSGLIWSHLCPEYNVASYWPIDKKPQKGRHKLDSVRVLALEGIEENVIDVDTYGAPWDHYFALLGNLDHPATVFLTVGLVRMGGGGQPPNSALQKLGLSGAMMGNLPTSMKARLAPLVTQYALLSCYDYSIIPIEAAEVSSGSGNVRYIGIRLEPDGVAAPAQARNSQED